MKKNILANCPKCGAEIAATLVADILDPSEFEQRCPKSKGEKLDIDTSMKRLGVTAEQVSNAILREV